MTDALSPSLLVEQAREMFFRQGLDPCARVAPHISRSWHRSRSLQCPPAQAEPLTVAQLGERREQAMRLLACAQPELDGLAEHAMGRDCVVILSDARGLILQEIGSPDFLPRAEQFALKPGVEWSEGHCGTNAIGTALVEREAVLVLGGEHYLAQNAGLGCAASPIVDGRGEIAGALDISGEAICVNQHALGLVRMAAQQVEHRMLLAGAHGHLLRFHARPALIGTPREGLLVITDGRIVAANRLALSLFGADWSGLLDRGVETLLGRHWSRLEQRRGLLTLPGGRQVAGVMERMASPRPVFAAVLPHEAAASTSACAPPPVDEIQSALSRALRVLNEGVPVLISGETGTGKDVFARRLHGASRRSAGPFVAVDCASMPETLIEAELFGYDEGAFTGARRRGMPGRIREANRGVLFLDEIAEMPFGLQSRLLRVLEERVVVPLGGGRGVAVDFDLVCATHGDIGALVQAGRFRADLMYRVAGFSVTLPPLRDRADQRELIVRLFQELGGDAKQLRLGSDALAGLLAHGWPGNVRELRSVLKSLIALSDPGATVGPADLPAPLQAACRGNPPAERAAGAAPASLKDAARGALDHALDACAHDVAAAARQLGVHRSTVYRHLARRQHGAGPQTKA